MNINSCFLQPLTQSMSRPYKNLKVFVFYTSLNCYITFPLKLETFLLEQECGQGETGHSLQPSPADQLQIPPIGSNDSPLGQVYSHPRRCSLSIFAQEMNFLQAKGWGKLPMSKHSMYPSLCILTLPLKQRIEQ